MKTIIFLSIIIISFIFIILIDFLITNKLRKFIIYKYKVKKNNERYRENQTNDKIQEYKFKYELLKDSIVKKNRREIL